MCFMLKTQKQKNKLNQSEQRKKRKKIMARSKKALGIMEEVLPSTEEEAIEADLELENLVDSYFQLNPELSQDIFDKEEEEEVLYDPVTNTVLKSFDEADEEDKKTTVVMSSFIEREILKNVMQEKINNVKKLRDDLRTTFLNNNENPEYNSIERDFNVFDDKLRGEINLYRNIMNQDNILNNKLIPNELKLEVERLASNKIRSIFDLLNEIDANKMSKLFKDFTSLSNSVNFLSDRILDLEKGEI